MKRIFTVKTIVSFVFLTFLASAVYVALKMTSAPSELMAGQAIAVRSDYTLMLLQCILGTAAMLLPGILQRKLKITIPSGMLVAFAIFLYCAIYLGEVHYFYYRIEHWDTLLHTFSGFALGALGLSIIGLLNKSERVSVSLSPAFVAIFAFCFAVAIGTVWEIYEFSVDSISGLNMQKYALENGELLIGQAALADTMKDLIVDAVGALVISVVGYVSMKRKEGWLDNMQINAARPVPGPVPAPAAAPVPIPVYAVIRQPSLAPQAPEDGEIVA